MSALSSRWASNRLPRVTYHYYPPPPLTFITSKTAYLYGDNTASRGLGPRGGARCQTEGEGRT